MKTKLIEVPYIELPYFAAPERKVVITLTHETIGDDEFCNLTLASLQEYLDKRNLLQKQMRELLGKHNMKMPKEYFDEKEKIYESLGIVEHNYLPQYYETFKCINGVTIEITEPQRLYEEEIEFLDGYEGHYEEISNSKDKRMKLSKEIPLEKIEIDGKEFELVSYIVIGTGEKFEVIK